MEAPAQGGDIQGKADAAADDAPEDVQPTVHDSRSAPGGQPVTASLAMDVDQARSVLLNVDLRLRLA